MSNTVILISLLIVFVFNKDENVLFVKHKAYDIIVFLYNKFIVLAKKIYEISELNLKELLSLKIQLCRDKKSERDYVEDESETESE
jgi:hypothetical protein